jgi:tripartite-type tricarboxylate transporter receptor subunit TctC
MLTRRQFTLTAAATLAASVLPAAAAVAAIGKTPEAFSSTKPITLVVSMPKNGPTDMMARFFAEPLAKALGQSVSVENITGNWGMTGAEVVSRAAADGHTLIMGQTATHAALPVLTQRYDALHDFTPIGLVGVSPMVVLVRRDLPFNNLSTLQAYLQANPGQLAIANGGLGSASALAAHNLKAALNAPFQQERVYTGTAAALEDLVQGRVDVLCDQMISALPMIRSGKVKAVGLTGISRNHAMPSVLTGVQQGFGDLRASSWHGVFAPKGLPEATQQRLAAAIHKVLDDVTVTRKMREHGLHVPFVEQRGPEQLATLQRKDMDDIASLYARAV